MKLDSIFRKLAAEGYSPKRITLSMPDSIRPAISIDTNYDGPYPTKETWAAHAAIERIVKRYQCESEPRGYWTAIYIW